MECLLAALRVQLSVSAGNECPHNAHCAAAPLAHANHAATSEIVKALLVTSLTHVSGAITSTLTF